jgi:hypothetical protein
MTKETLCAEVARDYPDLGRKPDRVSDEDWEALCYCHAEHPPMKDLAEGYGTTVQRMRTRLSRTLYSVRFQAHKDAGGEVAKGR